MAEAKRNQRLLKDFAEAQRLYRDRQFSIARKRLAAYRAGIDYESFPRQDRRPAEQIIHSSVVLVSYGSGQGLLDCLYSLRKQIDPHFEIILVDQGGNESVHAELATWPLLWVCPPINLFPSEGRNLGAYFARGELLIFLDDDAIAHEDFTAQAWFGMHQTQALALRGRILPRSPGQPTTATPPHYDLGDHLCLAPANLEGNLVVRRAAFQVVRGFDPLIFGHEGRELGWRLHQARRHGAFADTPWRGIYYWPMLQIRHDFANGERLATKRARHALGQAYLDTFAPGAFDAPERMDPALAELTPETLANQLPGPGITLILRAGTDLTQTQRLLTSLIQQAFQRPIEVLISAPNAKAAVAMIRPFLVRLTIRVLSPRYLHSRQNLSDLVGLGRYASIALVAETAVFSSNPWPTMLTTLEQQAVVAGPGELAETLLLCHRWTLGRGFTEPLDTPLPQLIKRLTIGGLINRV
ncbi:glycosyltransferase family 2 protein [Allochromatium vinosum]|uniref:Glycosyl transferase family 2 n=1 Tax=Allochromatium vinosum (strain ATCC 17899 / DSM 180 / NBRC 103801 / NCIMB 10441 / D) TaxID=572477 RepID=D3RMD6_ALLVD|nr:glycosyltransferase [Allochromatium vinosum]ADC61194.1 glycosyl transferase family 2 [Allochromatium vinosum DSM 180]